MPQVLPEVRDIVQQKKRGVLFVMFGELTIKLRLHEPVSEGDAELDLFDVWDEWETTPNRMKVLKSLDELGISWQQCYGGDVYIDVPYDASLPAYQKLAALLESVDGSRIFPDVQFCYMPFESKYGSGE